MGDRRSPLTPGPPTITVVVPARDAAATIGRTLAALAVQEVDREYEVIVVDSGSSDATAAIASAADGVRVLHNEGGEPASSRNLGARAGAGTLLAFTDADCEPEPGWLAAGLRALAGADIVQGRVTAAGPAGPFDRTVVVGSEYGLYETASLFVRRSAFEAVGGFAPVPGLGIGTGQPFGEDAWFVWRAKRTGAVSAFAADAVVRHAVFGRGAAGWIAEQTRCRHFPGLVALIPELRDSFLYRRWFLTPGTLRFDLAVVGVAVGVAAAAAGGVAGGRAGGVAGGGAGCLHRRRHALGPLALVAPYAAGVALDTRRRGAGIRYAAARVAADTVTCAALVRGSIRARTAVL